MCKIPHHFTQCAARYAGKLRGGHDRLLAFDGELGIQMLGGPEGLCLDQGCHHAGGQRLSRSVYTYSK